MSTTTLNVLTSVREREQSTILEIQTVSRLGFWAAFLTTLMGIGYGVAVIVMAVGMAKTGSAAWSGIQAYAAGFQPASMLPLIPSLFLAPAFTTLMVCIHYYAAPEKRIWSHLGLAYTLIYATMATINYMIQLTAVRRSLLGGETDGLAMFVHGNPHGIFWALVSAYVFMNLAMLFAAPVFQGGKLEIWIRRIFLLNGLSVVFTVAVIALDSWTGFMLGSLVIWCPLFTAAAALLTVMFWRLSSAGGKS